MSREPLPPDVWQRVKALFDEVQPLAPAERAAPLAAEQDVTVRDEVVALLAAAERADGLLEQQSEPAPLEAGRRLGPYEIRDRLGGGGMGEVYRAYDVRLRREVAVKVLRGWLIDAAARGRFEREARAVAALSHPNVLAVHDVGDASGVPYIVTELLSGENLRQRLRRGPPPVARALEWGAQIALGLAAAHDKGIVHRDLKPENVFLLDDGRVKILDFGLARLLPDEGRGDVDKSHSLPGVILGTAGYIAPERAHGKPAAATADLFALGAILFEMLTGRRAFHGPTVHDTLRAVVEHEPPPPSTVRPEVPRWLDGVVARCLAKDIALRFQSARDLAFVLGTPREAEPAPPARARGAWRAIALAGAAAAAVIAGAVLWPGRGASTAPEPPRVHPLTYSGRDSAPAVSPNGRLLAFASDRDGRSRIWLLELEGGREVALTTGPDDAPRFSPNGGEVLFTRAQGRGTSLYRVALLGGEVHQVADDGGDGDWSPDGRHVVFVRWRGDAVQARPSLMVAAIDGSGERELARLENRVQTRPRWSPDGRLVAVTGIVQQPGTPQTIVLVPVDGSPTRTLATQVGMLSAVAWDGPATVMYSQASSVIGNISGSARIVRQSIDGGVAQVLLWRPENSLVLDAWPGRGIVFDARSPRQNLREVAIALAVDATPPTEDAVGFLSRGTATDRQPVYYPDGERIAYSSNRGGNLDVWVVERRGGATQRVTDHAADDWDPAFTPDGRYVLWSSNRSGNFEVWMADVDGAHPRQVTHDGVDAENPTATRDGAWIVYSSGAPGRRGVWRTRPDGTDAALLVRDVILPEVSPDGRYVLYQTNRSPRLAVVGVASVPDGAPVAFEIRIDVVKPGAPLLGRARWMPGGDAIAFVGQDERGLNGVYVQRFAVGEDTTPSRVKLAGFDTERATESFGVSPRGDRLALAELEQRSQVMAATGLER